MAMPISQREAVGAFQNAADLRAAADTLMLQGFDRADLSILSGARRAAERLDRTFTATELEDDPKTPKTAYVGSDSFTELKAAVVGIPFFIGAVSAGGGIAASGGTTGSSILGALIAGGVAGAFGALLSWWLSRQHDAYLEAQLAHGGLLLWVRTVDPAHEERACRILHECHAVDVHVHDLPAPEVAQRSGKVVYGLLEFLAGVRPPAAR